jgi:multisubunit Na+/H+ antiporter MnhC subunit
MDGVFLIVVGAGIVALFIALLIVLDRQNDPRDRRKIQRDDSWGSRGR